ncbi:MAG: transglutaminase family protein [Nocardioides sp.]
MMQFRVVHRTRIGYETEAAASYNEARMSPLTSAHQVVVHTRLEVSPTPWSHTYRDYWGTEVTAFEVLDQHKELIVTATSTVQVDRPAPLPGGLTWAEVRAHEVADLHCEQLVVDERVAPEPDLAAQIEDLVTGSGGPTDFAHRLCQLVYDEVRYVSGSTAVEGHAADAWKARSGVCQDMAHIVIGALRSAGVPARYVSGYLHPSTEPVPGETVVGESHAWVEWWDGSWIGFDPTNNLDIGDRHVVVARGRDYADVPPLTGIFSGGGASQMDVEVEVTLLR